MGNQLGIIAGSGEFPSIILEEAKKSGYRCVVAAIKGEAESSLEDKAGILEWFDITEVPKIISFFKDFGVQEAMFAGKVDPRVIFQKEKWAKDSYLSLSGKKDKTPAVLLESAIASLAEQEIEIKSPNAFLSSTLCEEGVLTKLKPSPEIEEDMAFGWKIAKDIADLDIGQTVVVKDRAVVAVEGMEGTDEVIKRGARLAGEGTVIIKVARSRQDFRVDLPAIGLKTVKSLVEARSCALCFEAQRMPFFQKEKAVSLADANEISIVAKKY